MWNDHYHHTRTDNFPIEVCLFSHLPLSKGHMITQGSMQDEFQFKSTNISHKSDASIKNDGIFSLLTLYRVDLC